MTEDAAPPPTPPVAVVYHYRIFLVGGTFFDVSSPNDHEKFATFAMAERRVFAPGAVFVPWHAISAIAPIKAPGMGMTQVPGGNVLHGPWTQPPASPA